MKVKLNNNDIAEIAKSIKSGWLDMGKVTMFQSLIDGYNPPEQMTYERLEYYKSCLKKGWGYTPTDIDDFNKVISNGLDDDQLSKYRKSIENNSIYCAMVKDVFMGLLAMKALGGKIDFKGGDFSFMDERPIFK